MGKFEDERPEWIRDLIFAEKAMKWDERYCLSEIGMLRETDEIFNRYYGNPSLFQKTKLMARFGWQELWDIED